MAPGFKFSRKKFTGTFLSSIFKDVTALILSDAATGDAAEALRDRIQCNGGTCVREEVRWS